jgi:hypothetical protein
MSGSKSLARLRRAVVMTMALAALAAATFPAQAAENVLSVMPKDALGFVIVHRLAETDAKIDKLVEQIGGEAPALLETLLVSIGRAEMTGLDKKGSAAVVALPAPPDDEMPAVLLYVPTTDYKKLLEELDAEDAAAKIAEVKFMGGPFLAGRSGDYAVLAERKHREALERAIDAKPGVPDDLAPWSDWIGAQDAAAVVTSEGLKLLAKMASEGLDEIRKTMEEFGEEANPAVAGLGMYETMLKTAAEEVALVAVGGTIDAEGNVAVAKRARFAPHGKLAATLGEVKPLEGDPLGSLPADPFVFAGVAATPEPLSRAMMDFSLASMRAARELYGLSEEQLERLGKISSDSIEGLRGMAITMGVGKPRQPAYGNIYGLMVVDDVEKYMERYGKYVEASSEILRGSKRSFMKNMTFEKVKPGLWKLEFEIDFAAAMGEDMPEEARAMMPQLFGADGKSTALMAKVDDRRLALSYAGAREIDEVVEAIRQGKPGLGADEQLRATAALLPPGAPWAAYVSPKGYMAYTMRLMQPMFEQFGMPFQMPEFPDSPPIGIAAGAKGNELEARLVVPAATLKAIGAFARNMADME